MMYAIFCIYIHAIIEYYQCVDGFGRQATSKEGSRALHRERPTSRVQFKYTNVESRLIDIFRMPGRHHNMRDDDIRDLYTALTLPNVWLS